MKIYSISIWAWYRRQVWQKRRARAAWHRQRRARGIRRRRKLARSGSGIKKKKKQRWHQRRGMLAASALRISRIALARARFIALAALLRFLRTRALREIRKSTI
jgi:hypothetical protein